MDIPISADERIDMIWRAIADLFWDIPLELKNLFEFVAAHDICMYILVCFLISASVILLKRMFFITRR